jgi:hypothetical protein
MFLMIKLTHPLPPEVAHVTTRFLTRKDSVEPKALAEFRTIVKELTQQADAACTS